MRRTRRDGSAPQTILDYGPLEGAHAQGGGADRTSRSVVSKGFPRDDDLTYGFLEGTLTF